MFTASPSSACASTEHRSGNTWPWTVGCTCGTMLGLLLWMTAVGHGVLGFLLCGAIGLGAGAVFGRFLSLAPSSGVDEKNPAAGPPTGGTA